MDEVQVAPVVAGFVLAYLEGEQSVDVDLGAAGQVQMKLEVPHGRGRTDGAQSVSQRESRSVGDGADHIQDKGEVVVPIKGRLPSDEGDLFHRCLRWGTPGWAWPAG